jgi:hypothetical protein
MAYLKRKLGEWYREAPRPAHKQPAVDADEPAPAADDKEEATEADASSGGGDGVRWFYTRLVKRFDPNSTSGEHRSERRTGTARCQGCIAPNLKADCNTKVMVTP